LKNSLISDPFLIYIITLTFLTIQYSFKIQNTASRSTSAICQVPDLSTRDVVTTEDEPQDYLLSASDLDGEEETEEADPTPASWISAQKIAELRETHRRHPTDTGSPEYQVAGMTERISHLTMHLKEHPKDFSTRRGLVALVNKRRRLLNYLFTEDEQAYADIVGALGIRHKIPGAIASKEDKYGRYPLQKGGSKGKSKVNARKKQL